MLIEKCAITEFRRIRVAQIGTGDYIGAIDTAQGIRVSSGRAYC